MQRVGKSPISQMCHKADKALQKYIVARHPQCEACGGPVSCSHHWIEKSRSNRLRYDEENQVPLCRRCHFFIHNRAGKLVLNNVVRSHDIQDVIIKKRGRKWKNKMDRVGREVIKADLAFYQKALDYYEKALETLKTSDSGPDN